MPGAPPQVALALTYPPANPVRTLPDTVERGETFNITVNFTAPADNFSGISVIDFAPAGWNVTVNKAWCQPTATNVKATGNMAEITFQQIYVNGTNFTALYKVTVPCGAGLGNYTFDEGNISSLGYFLGNSSHIFEDITGDFNVTVVPPAICSQMSIDFYAAYNGTNPPNQTLNVWSSTPCMINWSLTDDANYTGYDWLSEYPTNGSCTDVYSPVNLSVNISGMPLGNYTANITIESPDANNSPRIVPVTLHISLATATLEGHVGLSGFPATNVTVRFFVPGTQNETMKKYTTTDSNGNFTIGCLIPGTYDVAVKGQTSLSNLVTGVNLTAGNTTVVDFGVLREGDAGSSNDDFIAGLDYGPLSNAWNSYPTIIPPPAWDPNVDFSRDLYVDGADYGPLSANWNDWGDCFGWPGNWL